MIQRLIGWVEDELGRETLKDFLFQAGFEDGIEMAASESEVMALSRQGVPSLVLLDCDTLRQDPYEACQRLKAKVPDLKVVLMASHVDAIDAQSARLVGADDVCLKLPLSILTVVVKFL